MAKRDSSGRFLPRSSTALVVRRAPSRSSSPRPIVIRQTTSPAKRGGGKRRRIFGGGHTGEKVRKGVAIGGFALGYLNKHYASQTIQKLPPIKGSHMATLAVGLHFFAKPRPGSFVDHLATAATAIGAFQLGGEVLGADSAEW